jgi:hypothetical protein
MMRTETAVEDALIQLSVIVDESDPCLGAIRNAEDVLELVERERIALRNALAEIARQATQGINTAYGSRILRQIEVKARAALTEGAGNCRQHEI